jgi:hypothetical protein
MRARPADAKRIAEIIASREMPPILSVLAEYGYCGTQDPSAQNHYCAERAEGETPDQEPDAMT